MATLLDALSIGTRTNFFLECSRQLMTLICFRIELDFDNFNIKLEIFLSTFIITADVQSIDDSTDIVSSATNFPLMRL